MKIERVQSLEILRRCSPILVKAYNGEPWNDSWTEEKAFEKLSCFFNSPKFIGWVATEGDKILGCCVGNIEPYFTGDYFYLKEMFVSPDSQRKGVGAEIMKAVKTHLETIDIKTVILFTSNAAFPFEFYKKHSFNQMENMCMMHLG